MRALELKCAVLYVCSYSVCLTERTDIHFAFACLRVFYFILFPPSFSSPVRFCCLMMPLAILKP